MFLLAKLSRCFYTLLHYLLLPAIMLRLLWRSRYTAAYRQRWAERFGFIQPIANASIWVHAVSLGEVNAAIPLLKELILRYPQYTILVTTTTPAGSAQVQLHFKDKIKHFYAPYDLPWVLRRFLCHSQAKLCIILEREIWPNILHSCRAHNIPVLLANARLSERSKRRYQMIPQLTQVMLQSYAMVAAQGILDGERLLSLGLPPKRLIITGNIKFDMQLPPNIKQQGADLREEWGATTRPVLVAASTHEGEEEIILDAFQHIQKTIPALLLVLVPRHPDRFSKVEKLCKTQSFSVVLRSLKQAPKADTDIVLGDTLGELLLLYAASDIAFVGGSLAAVGGHNLIEPAALGLPIITGPELHNFVEISQLLQNAGAARVIHDAKTLTDTVNLLFETKDLREKMGNCAEKVIAENRGALAKHLEWIEDHFPPQRQLYN